VRINIDILLHDYSRRDPITYNETILSLKELFSLHQGELKRITGIARKIRDGLQEIDHFILQANESVCQRCKEVCCISKHGYYTGEDLIYLFALGLTPPDPVFGRNDTDPCPYLLATGCSIERPQRPSQCNWYFCDSLLDYMEPRDAYREFDDSLRDIAELWIEMVDEFRKISLLVSVQLNHAKTNCGYCR
jgi:hypothetical protein